VVADVDDERITESAVEAMRKAQKAGFGGDLAKYALERGIIVSDEKLVCRIRKDRV
jgi:hypothetical protein